MAKIWPPKLKVESKLEAYRLIDTFYKKLPKGPDGRFNESSSELYNNDVDALRHAYVSGVFTQEYGETAADIFGRLQENAPFQNGSSTGGKDEENMDLWNNSVGRKYGKRAKGGEDLFKMLMKALKNGELITNPNDTRKYHGLRKEPGKNSVVVLEESETGENLVFYDVTTEVMMSNVEFVSRIEAGEYPNYETRQIHGKRVAVSKKDHSTENNLS